MQTEQEKLIAAGFKSKGNSLEKKYNGDLYRYDIESGTMLKVSGISYEKLTLEQCKNCIEFVGAKVFECHIAFLHDIQEIINFAKVCFNSEIEITVFNVKAKDSDRNALVVCPKEWSLDQAQEFYNKA